MNLLSEKTGDPTVITLRTTFGYALQDPRQSLAFQKDTVLAAHILVQRMFANMGSSAYSQFALWASLASFWGKSPTACFAAATLRPCL